LRIAFQLNEDRYTQTSNVTECFGFHGWSRAASAFAQVGGLSFPGPGPGHSSGGGGFTGPGDIVSFNLWAGLHAYNAANAAALAPIVDQVDQAGNNPITIDSLSTGALNAASITAWVMLRAFSFAWG
jgi:hypothetical protein